jgi:murein DD-endopeptidase MepM/ murein hydrolase activator NlpD
MNDKTFRGYIEPFSKHLRGDEFGNNAPYRNGRKHRGQDWHPAELTEIPAITDGTIVKNEWTDGLGWIVVHSTYDKKYVLYAHMAKQSPHKIGTVITRGTILGKVGGGKYKSGSFSTGAHLHLSIGKMGADYSGKDVHLVAYDLLYDPLKVITENPVKE